MSGPKESPSQVPGDSQVNSYFRLKVVGQVRKDLCSWRINTSFDKTCKIKDEAGTSQRMETESNSTHEIVENKSTLYNETITEQNNKHHMITV